MAPNELEHTALRIREAHAQEGWGRMLCTTKLPRARLAWDVSRWLTQLDTGTCRLVKLSGLTLSMEGRDLMGPRYFRPYSLATVTVPAVSGVREVVA